jgi:hypothetical protein
MGSAIAYGGNGMIRLCAVLSSYAALTLLIGCGPTANAPLPVSAPIADKPDVIITLDGVHKACVVALLTEAQGNSIPCADVIPFIRDELRLANGSVYDIRTISDVDEAEIRKVDASLKNAGYRFIGGPHGTEPKRR